MCCTFLLSFQVISLISIFLNIILTSTCPMTAVGLGVQKKYFKAWHMGKGLKKKEPSESDPIIPKDGKKDETDSGVSTYD